MSFVTPMALIICFMFLFIGVLGWRTDRLKPIPKQKPDELLRNLNRAMFTLQTGYHRLT